MKRTFDIVAATLGLIVLSPVLLLIALAVWLWMGPPILFRQVRPGYGARPFVLIKFRTMHEYGTAPAATCSFADKGRITPLGRLLRATSLDELPELWNVVKGEMSLVGPRPLLMDYLPLYSMHEARRHDVRPGITGWAQVNGRNALSWKDKFNLDVWYVDHRSFVLDMKIILLTLFQVFSCEGISQEGDATVRPFEGHRSRKANP